MQISDDTTYGEAMVEGNPDVNKLARSGYFSRLLADIDQNVTERLADFRVSFDRVFAEINADTDRWVDPTKWEDDALAFDQALPEEGLACPLDNPWDDLLIGKFVDPEYAAAEPWYNMNLFVMFQKSPCFYQTYYSFVHPMCQIILQEPDEWLFKISRGADCYQVTTAGPIGTKAASPAEGYATSPPYGIYTPSSSFTSLEVRKAVPFSIAGWSWSGTPSNDVPATWPYSVVYDWSQGMEWFNLIQEGYYTITYDMVATGYLFFVDLTIYVKSRAPKSIYKVAKLHTHGQAGTYHGETRFYVPKSGTKYHPSNFLSIAYIQGNPPGTASSFYLSMTIS